MSTQVPRNEEIERLLSQSQAIVTLMGAADFEAMDVCDGYSPILRLVSDVVVEQLEQVRLLATGSSDGQTA